MQNTISEPAVKKNWVMGICSQKGNLSTKHRSHQLDREFILIASVPYFLIKKNAKYIFRASSEKKMGVGSFSQKGNYQPDDRELFLIMFQVDSLCHLMA